MRRKWFILILAILLAAAGCEGGTPTKDSGPAEMSTKAVPGSSHAPVSPSPSETERETAPTEADRPTDAPESTEAAEDPLEAGNCADLQTDSRAFAVVDDNGALFLGRNMYEALAPASITKVLTALVTAETVSLDNQVVIPEEAVSKHLGIYSSGVRPSFKPGETVTVRDLLYALILPSTNAAGNILAFHVAGSIEAFAEMMNGKMAELGLTHSHFVNPHGMDEDGHYTCAYDMAMVLRAAVHNETVKKILGTLGYVIPATEYSAERHIYHTHTILTGAVPVSGAFAGKSGSTGKAKKTLLTAVQRNGKTFYICTMCSDEEFSGIDTRNIAEYAFARWNGTKTSPEPIPHDIEVVEENDGGVRVSYKLEHHPLSARVVVWNLQSGTSSARSFNDVPSARENELWISLTEKGAYHIQVFCTGQDGAERVAQSDFLFDGKLNAPGVQEFNGKYYYVEYGNRLVTGAVETSDGCYYTGGNGAFTRGFLGTYYAGSDFKLVTGWVAHNGQQYYFQADGRMATGKLIIDGVLHTFSDKGVLLE